MRSVVPDKPPDSGRSAHDFADRDPTAVGSRNQTLNADSLKHIRQHAARGIPRLGTKHLEKTAYALNTVCRVERRQHKMTRFRRLERLLGGFFVS